MTKTGEARTLSRNTLSCVLYDSQGSSQLVPRLNSMARDTSGKDFGDLRVFRQHPKDACSSRAMTSPSKDHDKKKKLS